MKAVTLKYNSEILSGSIFSVLAIVMWILIPEQIQTLEKSSINAQTIPKVAVAGLFIFSLALLIQGLRLPKKSLVLCKESLASPQFRKESRSFIFAAMLLVYGLLFNLIGYIADTILLVVAILLFYYCRKWWYYAIAIVTVFIVYAVFTYALNVNLPGFLLRGNEIWNF